MGKLGADLAKSDDLWQASLLRSVASYWQVIGVRHGTELGENYYAMGWCDRKIIKHCHTKKTQDIASTSQIGNTTH